MDERTETVLKKYLPPKYDINDAVWPLEKKNKQGDLFVAAWIAKHKALEAIAAHNNIVFDLPEVYERDSKNAVSMLVVGHLGEKTEWSIGEASTENYNPFKGNGYKWAMAEKRAKDRVVLKLMGLHGDVYSQEEADEFKEQVSGTNEGKLLAGEKLTEIRKLFGEAEPDINAFHAHYGTVNENGEGDLSLLKESQYQSVVNALKAKIAKKNANT